MTRYTDVVEYIADGAKPQRVVTLPVSAFTATYELRPECECSVGIRLPSQEDAETIETEAIKAFQANIGNPAAADLAYNQSRLTNLVALCICSPEDVTRPHDLFPAPNATLPVALTPDALKRLFDEIERLQIDTSPIFTEATDDDVDAVVELLSGDALRKLSTTDQVNHSRVRRYLSFVLELIQ